jgi:hypothetical protein
MTVVITVAGIEWPKEGKKQGKIIDSTGKKWNVWANQINDFQQYQSYEVTFETNDFKGQTYYIIKSAKPAAGNASFPLRTSAAPNIPRMHDAIPRGEPSVMVGEDQRRMDIFVCGAFNNMLSNPEMQPSNMLAKDFIAIINNLKAAWKRTLGPQPDPISSGRNDDMGGDGIDF